MWQLLLMAFCLMMVIEGLLPALAPDLWRKSMAQVAGLDNKTLRIMGLMSMLIGAGLLYLLR